MLGLWYLRDVLLMNTVIQELTYDKSENVPGAAGNV
jgi:hypothetical protein